MDQFDETRPEFKGFNAFYRDEIIQPLIIKDQERRVAVKRYKMSLAGGAVLAIPAALGAWSLSSIHLAFFRIGGCLMGSFALGRYFLKDIKAKTKGHIVSKVCSFVGLKFTSKHFTPMDLELFRGLHLLPRSDRDSFEDQISGQAHGAMFTLHEAHLEKERRGNKGPKYTTAFRGVMMRMDFPQKFLGRTIVLRDGGCTSSAVGMTL